MSSETTPPVSKLFFAEAIARALHEAMSRDPRVIVLGQDVGRYGGPAAVKAASSSAPKRAASRRKPVVASS